MKPEEILDQCAKRRMSKWDMERFKKDFPHLFDAIMDAIKYKEKKGDIEYMEARLLAGEKVVIRNVDHPENGRMIRVLIYKMGALHGSEISIKNKPKENKVILKIKR